MSKQMRAQLKSLLDRAEMLRVKNEAKGVWDETEAKEFEGLLGQADTLKLRIELDDKATGMKSWLEQPDGRSAVRQEFNRPAAPMEGVMDGIASDKSGELYSVDGLGDAKLAALKSGAYKDAFNQYLRAAARGTAIKAEAMKVLNEGTDTAGGFWVPPDLRQELVKKQATMAAVRPNAFVLTTGSDLVSFPAVTYTTDDKYTSGARFSWGGALASADISEATNPIAGRITIPVFLATAAIFMTRQQMEDNQFDLMGYITEILSETFTLGEEDAFINGTGIGQPQGFLLHPQATVVTASGGMKVVTGTSAQLSWGTTTTGTAVTTGIMGIEAALPPQYEARSKWYGAKATYSALRALSDSQNRPLWNVNDAWPNMANGYAANIMGYPIVKSQFMPALGASAYCMAFGDMTGYYIADRAGLSVEVLREVRALRDEVVIYARKRVGAQLVHYWKLKTLCAST